MTKYTIVKNGVVDNVIEADENYILANHDDDVVILGNAPTGYLFVDGHLISPDKIPVDVNTIVATTGFANQGVTILTKREFMQRFTQSERIAIRNSADDIVIDIYDDLKVATSVDLTLVDLANGLAYLVSVGLLTPERPAQLMA